MSRSENRVESSDSLSHLCKEEIERLLSSRFSKGFKRLKDIPHPFELHDMERAANRIAQAVFNGEKIAIVGDYDADGVVSTAILEEFFELIGYSVKSYIPNRFKDGYGVSVSLLERIKDVNLVITVDNGITAYDAAIECKKRGIDLIITDHHTVGDRLPDAYAVVNPKKSECAFAYPDICGAQVAWFLVGALKKVFGIDLDMARFLDLLSIAVIADVMPLKEINRAIVKSGIRMIEKSQRPAFLVLKDSFKKNTFLSSDIAYFVAPKINSAGRVDDAKDALMFLRSKDIADANKRWLKLQEYNERRKEIELQVVQEAIELVDEKDNILIVAKAGWHEGVVGIVASRLAEKYKKPSIVLNIDNETAKGSGRSVADIDLFALISKSRRFLNGFGGHKAAVGLKLDIRNLNDFKEELNENAKGIDSLKFLQKENILGILPISIIDWELIDILEKYEPYGEANEQPIFLLDRVKVYSAKKIGSLKEHLKLTVGTEQNRIEAVWFGAKRDLKAGDIISVTGSLQRSTFKSVSKIEFYIKNLLS